MPKYSDDEKKYDEPQHVHKKNSISATNTTSKPPPEFNMNKWMREKIGAIGATGRNRGTRVRLKPMEPVMNTYEGLLRNLLSHNVRLKSDQSDTKDAIVRFIKSHPNDFLDQGVQHRLQELLKDDETFYNIKKYLDSYRTYNYNPENSTRLPGPIIIPNNESVKNLRTPLTTDISTTYLTLKTQYFDLSKELEKKEDELFSNEIENKPIDLNIERTIQQLETLKEDTRLGLHILISTNNELIKRFKTESEEAILSDRGYFYEIRSKLPMAERFKSYHTLKRKYDAISNALQEKEDVMRSRPINLSKKNIAETEILKQIVQRLTALKEATRILLKNVVESDDSFKEYVKDTTRSFLNDPDKVYKEIMKGGMRRTQRKRSKSGRRNRRATARFFVRGK